MFPRIPFSAWFLPGANFKEKSTIGAYFYDLDISVGHRFYGNYVHHYISSREKTGYGFHVPQQVLSFSFWTFVLIFVNLDKLPCKSLNHWKWRTVLVCSSSPLWVPFLCIRFFFVSNFRLQLSKWPWRSCAWTLWQASLIVKCWIQWQISHYPVLSVVPIL